MSITGLLFDESSSNLLSKEEEFLIRTTILKSRFDAEWALDEDIVYFKDEEQYIIYFQYKNSINKLIPPGVHEIRCISSNNSFIKKYSKCHLIVKPTGIWEITPKNTKQIVADGLECWKELKDFVFIETQESEDDWF